MRPTYPGLGSADVIPLVNPVIDPAGMSLTPEDFYVLTRVDGRASFREVVLSSGLPESRAIEVLIKLRRVGAIHLPDEKPARKHAEPHDAADRAATAALMSEKVDLSAETRQAILDKLAQMEGATPRQILEVAPTADRRQIKLAYFKLSKEFHPDRFFGRQLGSFQTMLGKIFVGLAQAFATLTAEWRAIEAPRSRASYIYDLACQDQVTGDLPSALARFDEAIALAADGELPRILRRAAEAALAAGELRSAEEYVRKNLRLEPQHAGAHRILAKVHKALGRSLDARRELEVARQLDPGNPHIARELDELARSQ